jgi:hypothetical protein
LTSVNDEKERGANEQGTFDNNDSEYSTSEAEKPADDEDKHRLKTNLNAQKPGKLTSYTSAFSSSLAV